MCSSEAHKLHCGRGIEPSGARVYKGLMWTFGCERINVDLALQWIPSTSSSAPAPSSSTPTTLRLSIATAPTSSSSPALTLVSSSASRLLHMLSSPRAAMLLLLLLRRHETAPAPLLGSEVLHLLHRKERTDCGENVKRSVSGRFLTGNRESVVCTDRRQCAP